MATQESTPPPEVRSTSSSRRQSYNSSTLPHRTQSMASRSNPSTGSPQRSNSHSAGYSRPPSSSRQANLATVAQRDYEQIDLAKPPSSSSRRNSLDKYRDRPSPNPQLDSSKTPHHSHQRSSSRSGANRNGTDADPSTTNGHVSSQRDHHERNSSSIGGPTTSGGSSAGGAGVVRKRTTVTAQTGTWALGKTIGAGSMGKVKLARNLETGEQAAIKIVPRQSQDEHRTQQERERADHSKEIRTAREAAIVTLVNHPYICGMRDVYRTNYHWYMLFEYVNGGQMLDYIISHGRLKEKQARKFGRQIASALDYCHRNSIVHRDLKIENILISKEGNIKIIDFGLSNLFSPRSLLKTFCGSLYFAAPELLQAKAYAGPEVDIWSFGIVLYVLVCGKVPFDDQSMPQLHAKIKKGVVEYPPWLSAECKHIISRMLVTDPRSRASLLEIMTHPWMTKGFNAPPENCVPHREPLQLPLDPVVIEQMTGFDFGSSEWITKQLEGILKSDDYLRAVRSAASRAHAQADAAHKKHGMFDFYQRRKSASSRDTLSPPSSEHLGDDPINAYSPLISIYYLVKEKQEREKLEAFQGVLSLPHSPGEAPLALPDLPAPEAAYTNTTTFEMAGEPPTGGRSRPRARTHGEDEIVEAAQKPGTPQLASPPTTTQPPAPQQTPTKKEGTGIGILRRFSTRKGRSDGKDHSRDYGRDSGRDYDRDRMSPQPPPSVAVSGPDNSLPQPPRSGLSVRKTRERDTPPSAFQTVASNHPDLLAPPDSSGSSTRKLKGLGRSTSVNSGELRRRWSRKGERIPVEAVSTTSGAVSESEKSSLQEAKMEEEANSQVPKSRSTTSRARSMGHGRRDSMQIRRLNRDHGLESDVPEETDAELAEEALEPKENGSSDKIKPVYLKGLFSVSTTSSKPLTFIRSDIIRVLKQLGVDYKEIKGGFTCRHIPSIDLNKVTDNPPTSSDVRTSMHQKRRISFAGVKTNDKERDEVGEPHTPRSPVTPKLASRRLPPDSSYTNSEDSDEGDGRHEPKSPAVRPSRVAGETTTQVQSDLGQSMILKFEILVVKVPLLSLHGLQFKKVDGGTWQYKKMAENILSLLRL